MVGGNPGCEVAVRGQQRTFSTLLLVEKMRVKAPAPVVPQKQMEARYGRLRQKDSSVRS